MIMIPSEELLALTTTQSILIELHRDLIMWQVTFDNLVSVRMTKSGAVEEIRPFIMACFLVVPKPLIFQVRIFIW